MHLVRVGCKFYLLRCFKLIKMSGGGDVPFGTMVLHKITSCCCPRVHYNRRVCYQVSVLVLTYFSYMCYHLTRKPISVVKTVLHQNCSSIRPPDGLVIDKGNVVTWCDWAPFDGSDEEANALLGSLDLSFLIAYAIAMFFSGFIAERVNLRYFLAFGMLFSGIFSYLFGLAKTCNIHSMSYFVLVQIAAGIAQTTGWPGVVCVVSNWFGRSKRGLIFGIWNSHTSIGNILGTLIAARFLEKDWAMSFMVPGLLMGMMGFIVFLFLVPDPADVGMTTTDQLRDAYKRLENNRSIDRETLPPYDEVTSVVVGDQDLASACLRNNRASINYDSPPSRRTSQHSNERTHLLGNSEPAPYSSQAQSQAIGFTEAIRIPGVVEFSLSLFFAKLVSYTFLYWLPLYIKNSTSLTAKNSADLSTLFDIGGILGAILAGAAADRTSSPAITCAFMLFWAAPMLVIYEKFGTINILMNSLLLFISGVLVNGPYALITTSVSAELGTHSSLEGNSKALATVTAIIDGTGSIGAAIGPMLAALVSASGWSNVFYMLIVCDIFALILLLRLVRSEYERLGQSRVVRIE